MGRPDPAPLDPVETLRDAVAIASPSGAERAVAEHLVGVMAGVCREAWRDAAGNAVGVWGGGPLRVAVLGHIDTVPGEIPVRTEKGELWGRGSVDAKGAFCTAIAAVSRLGTEVADALTIQLIGAVEEEAPSSAGARHAVATYPRPDLLVIGEPSGWDGVTLGYKGRLVLHLAADLANAHSAGPEATAAERVIDGWNAVRVWAERASDGANGIFDAVQASLQATESRNDGLRQRARATVGLRLPPSHPPERARREIVVALREAGVLGERGAERDPDRGEVRATFTGDEVAYRGPRDTPLTRAFRVAIRSEGGRPRTVVKTGTSDMNVVAPRWDVPVLAYGPGDSGLDHAPDERVSVADVQRAARVLAAALTHLAANASPDGRADGQPDERAAGRAPDGG